MKRRRKAVNNGSTKVQLAIVTVHGNAEKKAIIIDHLRNIALMQDDDNGDMKLSVGVFNSTPTKYTKIKRLIAGNFTSNDSDIINQAIIGVSMKAPKTEKPVEPSEELPNLTTAELDLEREIACYNHAVECAKKIVEKIGSLISTGIPKEYVLSRYPDIEEKLQNFDSVLSVKRMELADVVEKKTAIKAKIEKLQSQLQTVEYDEYLKREEYISILKNCTESLDFDDSLKPMLEEDLAELNKLKRIKELEEELAALKSEGKFVTPTQSTTPAPVVEKPVVELDVELATEAQDREIRYLANHLYRVRLGNEDHNPVIYRKIAELSEQVKLPKPEFCTKYLSISYTTYDRHHREFMNSLGLHIYGERITPPMPAVDPNEVKTRILQWANIHLIPSDEEQVLNKDAYNAFLRETNLDVQEYSFYQILKRRGGYVTKNIRHYQIIEDGAKKLVGRTFYVGYKLV